MATKEQVRAMTTAQPFRPFLVKLAGGRTFEVRHPENIACDLLGRGMTIYDEQGMHLLEMLLVELIEPVMEPAKPKTEGDGE
jgi:hypothetical protein